MVTPMRTTAAMPGMSTTRQGAGGGASRLGGPVLTSASVRWDIGARALVSASAGAKLLNGHAAGLRACSLLVRVTGLDGSGPCLVRASLELVMGGGAGGQSDSIPLTETPGAIATLTDDPAAACVSIDAPGLLSLTVRTAGAEPALLFARSGLLADRLGLPGGVYDAPELALG